MFNEIQIGLLKEARYRIENGLDRFICVALDAAVQKNCAGDAEAVALKQKIDSGIGGYSTLELWMFHEFGIYPDDLPSNAIDTWNSHYLGAGWTTPLKRVVFNELLKNSRLAWLDRALETGSLT